MKRNRASLIQPRQLEAIVAVARAGSVHAAARTLGIPQPALSRLIAAAEEALGVHLFERSRSGTRTTPSGERVLQQAAFALRTLEGVSEAAKEPLPVVKLGCIPRVMHVLMPHLLAQLSDGAPGFRLRVSVGTSNEMVDDLLAARLEFVIGRRVARTDPSGADLEADKLYSEGTVVVSGSQNKFATAPSSHISELARYPWVLPKPGYFSRDLLDRIVSAAGLPPLVPVIESHSFESSLSVVAATKFLSIAPEFAAKRFERLRLVKIVRTRPTLGSSPVMLLHRAAQRDHPAFAAFRSAVMKAAREVRSS